MDEKRTKYLEELSKTNTPLFPFDVIATKIWILERYIEVLNKHPEDFPKEFRERLQEKNVKMGETLTFYIIQEIQDFYRHAYLKFGDKAQFPETAESVRGIRGSVIAHINTKSSSEIAKECIEIEQKYGFDRICSEWRKFRNTIYTKLKL